MFKKIINKDQMNRLLDLSSNLINQSNPEATTLTFMARPFVQATLPHRDPGNKPEWIRRNGELTLSIRSGWQDNPLTGERESIGIPFGTIPRLFLFWLTREAKRYGKREIELGSSLNDFMRKIGLNTNGGGIRSDSKRLRDQLNRLLKAAISIEQNTKHNHAWLNMNITSCGNLWKLKEFDNFRKIDIIPEGTIRLNEEFFSAITSSAIPLDERIITEIKQSPLALDLYAWLNYRAHTQSSFNNSLVISWQQIFDQCGSEYSDMRDFTKKAKNVIQKIQILTPSFKVEFLRGRLKIMPKLTIVK